MTESDKQPQSELAIKLIEARKQKKMSLQDVASKLNLSVDKLQALESEQLDLAKLNNFERGYLRNYAAYLELDISHYEAQFPTGSQIGSELQSMNRFSDEIPAPIVKTSWVKRIYYLLIILLVIGLLVMFTNSFTQSDIHSLVP